MTKCPTAKNPATIYFRVLTAKAVGSFKTAYEIRCIERGSINQHQGPYTQNFHRSMGNLTSDASSIVKSGVCCQILPKFYGTSTIFLLNQLELISSRIITDKIYNITIKNCDQEFRLIGIRIETHIKCVLKPQTT